MTHTDKYYVESGNVGLHSILLMIVAGVATSTLLGAIYGYAIFYIPFIYLNFFITLFFGGGVGWVVGKTGYFTKVRNGQAMLILGIVSGLVAEYMGWVFWIYAASEQSLLSFEPGTVFAVIGDVAENGAWNIFGWTPTGAALYVIWAIEAGIIILATTFLTIGGIGRQPFCEQCDQWTEEETLSTNLAPIENPEKLISGLEQNDLSELLVLKKVDASEPYRTKVQLFNCQACGKTHYLTIGVIIVTINDKDEAEEEETTIVENLILTHQSYEEIKKWSETLDGVEVA